MNAVVDLDKFEEVDPPAQFLTLLNETGDTTLTWDEPDDVDVLTFIQKKIDEGYLFFIEQPAILRFFMRKKRIWDVSQVKQRKLYIADDDAAEMEFRGKIRLAKMQRDEKAEKPAIKRSTDAKEIARSRSYGMRPIAGG